LVKAVLRESPCGGRPSSLLMQNDGNSFSCFPFLDFHSFILLLTCEH
jgi:hypothetical protein